MDKQVKTKVCVIPICKNLHKWENVKDGSFFLQNGNICLKLPSGKDKTGIFNCYCFDDNKYYTNKDYQEVIVIKSVNLNV